MTSSRPAVLVIGGAWHPPACYDPLRVRLEAMGYEYYCPQLPSLGAESRGVTFADDVEAIQKLAVRLFDQGKEVVIIGHSSGGLLACDVTQGHEVAQRAKEGKPGGFRHVIFLAAFFVPARGMDMLQTLGGAWPDWQIAGEPYTKGHLLRLKDSAKQKLFSDLPDSEAQRLFESLLPHSQDAFETPSNFIPDDITMPKTYIICEKDAILSIELQKRLIAQSPGFRSESINTGHSPFLTEPDEFAELVKKIIIAD
ncbi:hypothetical protein PFICI_04357 [Pestalotiopsis fici W106-1]|uniref:AB hydrolase-1 domain-containing protein n=1 Tax=Pestalotiopsis fici (strain W106-1 / CGMCC3.15140) TaxID=1229662 RepID=W3XBB3_PESFW|nr:uncharacterized protein PFICI_04357 [Pestalotiopsis fici W106-1]ETS82481.1 hypothetical protein PFICI_04357 [Pestalotiopsis fici W106-1]